jgi:hypothetical protein
MADSMMRVKDPCNGFGKTVGGIDDQVNIPAFSSNLEWRKAEYYKGEEIVLWSDWH